MAQVRTNQPLRIRNDQKEVGVARIDASHGERRMRLTAMMRLMIEKMHHQ
jgi:hypothetical protein